MRTKKELLQELEEALDDNVNIESYALFFLLDDDTTASSVDIEDNYYKMLGVMEDAKLNSLLDLREENKARLNKLLSEEDDDK